MPKLEFTTEHIDDLVRRYERDHQAIRNQAGKDGKRVDEIKSEVKELEAEIATLEAEKEQLREKNANYRDELKEIEGMIKALKKLKEENQ